MSRAVLAVFVFTFFACGPVAERPDGSGGGLSISPNSGGGPSSGGGPAGGGPSNGGGPSGTGGGSSSGGQCCINDAFYACGSSAAFQQCAGFDVGACLAACAPMDVTCPQGCFMRSSMARPDPSACTRDVSRDGECGSSSGTCNTQRGVACTLDSQCSSRNCTEGYCRANSAGARCTLDSHCESRNCTDGCCRNTSTSSACTLDSQCTTRNCTNGRCSGNGRGSACTLDSHCTSRNCTNGRCQ
jgi:hypothetical protein